LPQRKDEGGYYVLAVFAPLSVNQEVNQYTLDSSTSPMTSDVTLYGLSRSVYTRIARLALEEKGVDYELNEIEIFGNNGVPADHLRRHPFGRIPALQHGEFSLYETGAITRYVDEGFSGPALQPTEGRRRARMNQVIGLLDAYAYRPMVWGIFVQRVRIPLQGGKSDEETIRKSIPIVETCLDCLEGFLERQSFLAGESLTLADLHTAPMLLYLLLAEEGRTLVSKRARLNRWLDTMRGRRSIGRTTTVYEQA
jgi:glutathione S-transferase